MSAVVSVEHGVGGPQRGESHEHEQLGGRRGEQLGGPTERREYMHTTTDDDGSAAPPHSSASSITRLGLCPPPPDSSTSSTPSASRPTSATPRGSTSAVVGTGLGVVVGAGITSPRTGAAPPSAHDGAYPRRPLPMGSGRTSVAATLAARSAAGKAIYGGAWDTSDPMQERARRAIAAVTAAGESHGHIHRAPPPGHLLQGGQPLGAREQPARQAPSWAPSEASNGELFTPEHSLAYEPGNRGGDRPPPLLHRHAQAIGGGAVSGAESLRSRSPATIVDKGVSAAELPAAARPSSPSDFE